MKDWIAERNKIDNKIAVLKKEKSEVQKELNKIEKARREKQKAKEEAFERKLYKLYQKAREGLDEESHLHYHYFDDVDASHIEMIKNLMKSDCFEPNKELNTSLPYDWERIVDEKIAEAEEFADAMKNGVVMLKRFKKMLGELK